MVAVPGSAECGCAADDILTGVPVWTKPGHFVETELARAAHDCLMGRCYQWPELGPAGGAGQRLGPEGHSRSAIPTCHGNRTSGPATDRPASRSTPPQPAAGIEHDVRSGNRSDPHRGDASDRA